MATTTPPAISGLPAAPDPNDRSTFNTLAYPWSAALPAFGTQVSAVAANVKANADEVITAADAAMAAGLANAAANAAAATAQAGIATTKAGEANTSAIAANDSAVAAAASVSSIAGGPVASVNGMTGVVTGVATLTGVQTLTDKTIAYASNVLTGVQPTLVSGTSIKTVGGNSVLGSGDLPLSIGDKYVSVHSGNDFGSTNNRIRRFTTTLGSAGTAITYADSATLGASFTINETGLYSIVYTEISTASVFVFGVSVNSSQPTTNIDQINIADRLLVARQTDSAALGSASTVVRLQNGDVVRPHAVSGGLNGTSNLVSFTIRKVGV